MTTNTQPAKRGRPPILEPQRKQLILTFLSEYRKVYGGSPTYIELTKGIGYSKASGGSVFTLVDQLVDEGWLYKFPPNASRNLRLKRPETDVYHEITDSELLKVAKKQKGLKILT